MIKVAHGLLASFHKQKYVQYAEKMFTYIIGMKKGIVIINDIITEVKSWFFSKFAVFYEICSIDVKSVRQ